LCSAAAQRPRALRSLSPARSECEETHIIRSAKSLYVCYANGSSRPIRRMGDFNATRSRFCRRIVGVAADSRRSWINDPAPVDWLFGCRGGGCSICRRHGALRAGLAIRAPCWPECAGVVRGGRGRLEARASGRLLRKTLNKNNRERGHDHWRYKRADSEPSEVS
jgi:hypothetical protein